MMRFETMRRLGLWAAMLLAWCLWPGAAQAQAYPCNGAGPGERMVGMTQGGNGVAPVPLCVRDGGGGTAPSSTPTQNNSYAGMAWHPNAADVWADGNYLYSAATGEGAALRACNKVMGGGCTAGARWGNSSLTIIRDASGYFYKAGGDEERAQVMAECTAKQLLPCEIFAKIGSGVGRRKPGASVRKSFVVAAWAVGDGYDGKIYVASGHPSREAAAATAIKVCSDATGRKCEENAVAGNGFIQAYRMGTNDFTNPETSASRAKQAAQANCKKRNATTCELQALFDSRKPGLFVHDFENPQAK
jgi:hypothetical protein